MKELQKTVEQLVSEELARASEKFGDKHNSSHEAYAVILEEFEEAREEFKIIDVALNSVWIYTKINNSMFQKSNLKTIKERAILAACELIQVAAMAEKALRGYE